MTFSEAVFISTDGLFDEISSNIRWQPANSSEDLYTKRLREQESFGAGHLPRLFKSLVSTDVKSTAYFLAELKTHPRSPDPDHLFKDLMHDYCKSFDNKSASTEDFKAIVEKHMIRGMDLDGNHKMDWFFNEYVYGTGMPQYSLSRKVEPTSDGKSKVTGTLSRSGVPEDWKDAIPVYLHAGDKSYRIGIIGATHSSEPLDFIVPGKVDRVSINDNEDLLADVKQ